MAKSRIRCKAVPALAEEIARRYASVARRAHERYESRRYEDGGALGDWLGAEAELIWTPAVEVAESESAVVVEAAVAGVEPDELEVQVSPAEVLIQATGQHTHPAVKGTVHLCEFRPGLLFRVVRLPRTVNAAKARAEYRNGLLKVTVPLVPEPPPLADALSRHERP